MIGEELHTKLEEDNEHNEHAVAVILYNHAVIWDNHAVILDDSRPLSPYYILCVVVLFRTTSMA